ncbi:ribonuclease HII [Mycoplasmopsis hyopharyngis]|uniref:ribonuclease HII n=1 Tax=Mycoplasmopsis hyopharyngis TaxID=29558 RepID=UPI003873C221
MNWIENELQKENKLKIIGCDEVGRGCCAGPLVVAAVLFPTGYQNDQIYDSKKLSDKQRRKLVSIIQKDAIEYHYQVISSKMVDQLNPKNASIFAMENAIKSFTNIPDLVLTDFEKITCEYEQINLIKGDQKSISIAAASILAKVYRDDYMIELAKEFPKYGFEKHKGYCTKDHEQAMGKYGLINEHRITYKNVAKYLKNKQN